MAIAPHPVSLSILLYQRENVSLSITYVTHVIDVSCQPNASVLRVANVVDDYTTNKLMLNYISNSITVCVTITISSFTAHTNVSCISTINTK